MDSPTIPQSRKLILAPADVTPRLFVSTKAFLQAFWPALVATALFLAVMGYEIAVIKAHEGGRFVYVLDDSYGHLATAKNLARHGMWTYNHANGFESAESSLLWPVMIAGWFLLFGVHESVLLILNILALVATLFYIGAVFRRMACSGWLSLFVLCFIVLFTPFAAVAATGMEHSVQIFLSVVFVDLASRLLQDDSERTTTAATPWWLCIVGVLLVMARYEGMFFITAVGLLLLCRQRWKLAIILGVVSVAPIVLFGLYAVSKGWFFLPNPIVVKGNVRLLLTVPGIIQYFSKGYETLVSEEHMPALIAAAVVALVITMQRHWNMWTYRSLVLVITLITAAQHLQFASIGWFYRYEAYLVVLVFFGVGLVFGDEAPPLGFRYWLRPAAIPHLAALVLAVLFVAVPFWPRTSNAYPFIISASYSIYGQQYQMARFLRRFYPDGGVIANDVCAISYMDDNMRLVDIAALCSIDVLRLRLGGKFDQAAMRRLSQEHGSDIVIVYDNWLDAIFGGPLPEWVKMGTWTIPHNTVSAGDTVTFYATSQERAPYLLSALQKFATELPADVRQEGLYRGAESNEPVGVLFPAGGPKEALHYWTPETAQFALYPTSGQVVDSNDAKLNLALFAVNQNQTIDVYFNDELVLTKALAPGESQNWTSFPVSVKWHPGRNVLKLVGHGTPEARPGDPRPVLFAVLDPRRQIAGGKIDAQAGVVQPKELDARDR